MEQNGCKNEDKKLLTITDISTYLSIKQKTLYAKVESGEIPHYRIGHLIRFRLDDINAWLDGCRRCDSRQGTTPVKRTRAGKTRGSFDKVVTKIIDEEKGKYYPASHGKSGRIEDLGKEVDHGSV